LFASQENFGSSQSTSGKKNTSLGVNPHKALFKSVPEYSPVRSMPGKENDIAVSLRSLLDEPNFASTKAANNN
jgi:hypothetical protein